LKPTDSALLVVYYKVFAKLMARNGHGCMLQYALLHLFGYKVTIDDLKAFRVRILVFLPIITS
jgi:hypothetical protein